MVQTTRQRTFSVFLIISILLSGLGRIGISPALASGEESPAGQTTALEATLDESIDLDQFRPRQDFIVHFNLPMDPASSTTPVMAFPQVTGLGSWDETHTVLTFTPGAPLEVSKSYTFFLDPALKSADGSIFETTPQWKVYVTNGLTVRQVSPPPGETKKRKFTITLTFDRDMAMDGALPDLSIQPEAPIAVTWKDARVLQIELQQALEPGKQYEFILAGGTAPGSALGADGVYMVEDFRWSYRLPPLEATVNTLNGTNVKIEFNYPLDKDSLLQSFTISPDLEGEWKWSIVDSALHYITVEPIPVGQQYNVKLTGPLVDDYGPLAVEQNTLTFSAIPPIKINTETYYGNQYLPADGDIRIRFNLLVDRASAEQALKITPDIPGTYIWESDDKGNDVLVLRPYDLLSREVAYTFTISSDLLRSRDGGPVLFEPYVQEVWADSGSNVVSFGEGVHVQVVDSDGPRKIQFRAAKGRQRFDLYRFDLIDFAGLYAEHYNYRPYYGERNILVPSGEDKPEATWYYTATDTHGETLIPVELPPGLYILNASVNGKLNDQMFIVLSRNTLVVKRSSNEIFAWVTDINGGNIPEAEVRVYSEKGEKIRQGKADESGFYRTTIPEGYEPMLVSAQVKGEDGMDVTLSGFSGFSSDTYWYWWDSPWTQETQRYLVYTYTDRPIYRPGQTVNFKTIVRQDNDVKYSLLPTGTSVTVRIRDGQDNLLQTIDLNTNRFGTANGSFQISEGAGTGDYFVEVQVGEVTSWQKFMVEDYRKPDYQLSLTPKDPAQAAELTIGDTLVLEVDASYFFGEPLAGVQLKSKIYDLRPYYSWSWDEGGYYTNYFWSDYRSQAGLSNSIRTDENGKAVITFKIPKFGEYEARQDWYSSLEKAVYAIEITADDGSHQTVSTSYIFTVYGSSEKISLSADGYFHQADKPFQVTANAADILGQPVAGRELFLRFRFWNFGSYKYTLGKESYTLVTDENGQASLELNLPHGYYQLELTGRDSQGNSMKYTRWLCVFKDGGEWAQRDDYSRIRITADNESYKPYQTARFMIESTFSGPALLTFERGHVINTKLIELTAPLTVVETNIIPEYAPNVYVTVNAWQLPDPVDQLDEDERWGVSRADSYLRTANTGVTVEADAKALQVTISTDKEVYAPRESMTATIEVRDSSGQPVTAEVSLALVDEAIFALSEELSPDIFKAFYGPRRLTVDTYDSMSPKRYLFYGGGRGGGGDDGSLIAPRSDFPDTVAWFPTLQTDSTGKVSVTIELPDSLTRWRLTAKAVTLTHKVGQGQANFETKQEVLVRPVLPRILTSGDQAELTAFVHNYGITSRTFDVKLEAPGLEVQGEVTQQVTVAPGEVLPVGWQVIVEGVTDTEVTISATSSDGAADAVRLPLPIQPVAVLDIQNQSGEFTGTLALPLPLPEIQPENSSVTLYLSRTMSNTLLNGLEYLTGYPYGCIEQTMSRALPNAVVARASESLGLGGLGLKKKVDPLVMQSLHRLYAFQHYDGGWGWWLDDDTNDYQTAWVLFGLGLIAEAGYEVDAMVISEGASFLDNHLDDMDIRTRAYALYSMALVGKGNLDQSRALATTSLKDLDPFSQAALALAFQRMGETEMAKSSLEALSAGMVQKSGRVFWLQPGTDGQYSRKTMASTLRTSAMATAAYVAIDPQNPLIPGMVEYLATMRQGRYGWGTTNETTFTILALTDYLASQQEQEGQVTYQVSLDGKSLSSGVLELGNNSVALDLPLADMKPGLNTLLIETEGGAKVYFDLSSRFSLPQSQVDAAGRLIVTRRYLDPKTNQVLNNFQPGQLVKVELVVHMPEDASYIAIEDHLPGGFEALNESLNITGHELDYYGNT